MSTSRIQIPLAPAEAPQTLVTRSLSFLLRRIALEPLVTAPLLYILSNRARLSQSHNATLKRLATTLKLPLVSVDSNIKILKTLLTFGLLGRLHNFLNTWSQNNFRFGTAGGKGWTFQPPESSGTNADNGDKELVVITGGSSGFGYHMALYFATYTNAEIVVLDVVTPPDHLQKEHKNIHFYKLDLSVPMTSAENEIASTCDLIRANHGHPTVLINNAGIGRQNFLFDVDAQEGGVEVTMTMEKDEKEKQHIVWLEKIMHVNLISYFTLIRQFVPGMKIRGRGHVVTIASVASYTASGAGLADYCATKAGVMALHESLGAELASKGLGGVVQTTIVHPFWARTNIIKDYEKLLDKMKVFVMGPEAVASRVVRQIVTEQTGRKIFVPDGIQWIKFLRVLPRWAGEVVRILDERDTRRAVKKI